MALPDKMVNKDMKKMKMYEPGDKMIELIRDNYNVLQGLGAFGISLGFGDKTVHEVCEEQQVDTTTFLAVVNLILNDYHNPSDVSRLSVSTLLKYLKASHEYYLGFQLPFIRKELKEALEGEDGLMVTEGLPREGKNLAWLTMRLYDEYARSIQQHMKYEERTLFPYVEALLRGEVMEGYDADTFSKHHGDTSEKLKELKDIIIKYLPADGLHNHQLTATLYDIYNNEEWLKLHALVEDEIFIPAIRHLEQKSRHNEVSQKISSMITQGSGSGETLSEREKEIIVSLVQGMSNKEIAEHLFISVNTVMTHRRNIARKLQIHSPAGLTIYAIVNNLIDISNLPDV